MITVYLTTNAEWLGIRTHDHVSAGAAGANFALLISATSGDESSENEVSIANAYRLLRENNFPESNIVTFAYRNIEQRERKRAYGADPYGDVKVDYHGDRAKKSDALSGILDRSPQDDRGRKLLRCGPTDNVFVYYSAIERRKIAVRISQKSLAKFLGRLQSESRYNNLFLMLDVKSIGPQLLGTIVTLTRYFSIRAENIYPPLNEASTSVSLVGTSPSELGEKWIPEVQRIVREAPGNSMKLVEFAQLLERSVVGRRMYYHGDSGQLHVVDFLFIDKFLRRILVVKFNDVSQTKLADSRGAIQLPTSVCLLESDNSQQKSDSGATTSHPGSCKTAPVSADQN
ncbi:unnamed protein product [Calicophoron daubneyi]|uniref:Uncharacterized protein n=1 Tax=Calicophoron daubneyi TaxID=300641 RepID=A0AAV2TWU4_CALDB